MLCIPVPLFYQTVDSDREKILFVFFLLIKQKCRLSQQSRLVRVAERKAKEAEAAMRKIVRAAREEHRRSSVLEPPAAICLGEGEQTYLFIIST